MDDVYIIIPIYNEGPVVGSVLKSVLKKYPNVVAINDGSRDNSAQEIAKTKAYLLNHPLNLGQGAAIQTGIDFALQNPNAKYFVTFDADGQHSLKDVESMVRYIRKHPVDIVLGSRFLGEANNMSKTKKAILRLAIAFSNLTSGIKLTDTHNGLRVFTRDFAEQLNITMSDMAHASEIIQRIADNKFRYHEMPTTVTYSDYSVAKSHNPSLNAVNIVFDTLLQKVTKR